MKTTDIGKGIDWPKRFDDTIEETYTRTLNAWETYTTDKFFLAITTVIDTHIRETGTNEIRGLALMESIMADAEGYIREEAKCPGYELGDWHKNKLHTNLIRQLEDWGYRIVRDIPYEGAAPWKVVFSIYDASINKKYPYTRMQPPAKDEVDDEGKHIGIWD